MITYMSSNKRKNTIKITTPTKDSIDVAYDVAIKIVIVREQLYLDFDLSEILIPLDFTSLNNLVLFLYDETIITPLQLLKTVHKVQIDDDLYNIALTRARQFCNSKFTVPLLKNEMLDMTSDTIESLLFRYNCCENAKATLNSAGNMWLGDENEFLGFNLNIYNNYNDDPSLDVTMPIS